MCTPARFSSPLVVALVLLVSTQNHLLAQNNYVTPYTFTTEVPTSGYPVAFNQPLATAVDGSGNIYVADSGDSTIWVIAPSGSAHQFAMAENEPLYSPQGIALDSSGNIYTTSPGLVQKLTPGGTVENFVGDRNYFGSADGTGTAARFNRPYGIALDSKNNLYVSDTYNSNIRKITPAGVVTTLAGSALQTGTTNATGTLALFNQPAGVAVDSLDNVYVADSANHTIRKITPTGVVTTFAGSAGNRGTNDGTGTGARFDYPEGLAIDSSGNLYVSEYSNALIRKITSQGVVTTLAGQATVTGTTDGTGMGALFNGPMGLSVDSHQNLYVADTYNNTIRLGTPGPRTPQILNFPAIGTQVFGYAPINPGGTTNSGGTILYTIVSGPALIDGSIFLTGTGTVTVNAVQGGTTAYGAASVTQSFTVVPAGTNGVKGAGVIAFGTLTFPYDGTSHPATVQTHPDGAVVDITYNGSSTAPTNPGSYTVVATMDDPNYQASATATLTILAETKPIISSALTAEAPVNSAFSYQITASNYATSYAAIGLPSGLSLDSTSGEITGTPTKMGAFAVTISASNSAGTGTAKLTLTVGKATATVDLPSPQTAIYSGKAIAATATTVPAGLPLKLAYTLSGKAATPVNGGTYLVTATIDSTTYAGSATGTLEIGPATATITLGDLTQTYTGKALSPTVTTVPARLPVTLAYAGSPEAPAKPGNYAVTATIESPNYGNSASGTLTITPVPPIPVTGAATLISAQTATLNGTVNPEGLTGSAYFQYYYVGNTGTVTVATAPASKGNGSASVAVSAQVTGLVPGTLYHVQMIADNGITTVAAAAKTFTTLAAPTINPPAPALQAPGPQLSASGVVVSASVNPAGVATKVYVEYGTDPNNLNASSGTDISAGAGKVPIIASFSLSGLAANTTYYYEVFTTSAAGLFHSTVQSFVTLGFETTDVAATKMLAPGTSWDWATLGSAAVNATDGAAFRATLDGAAAEDTGIWANVDNSGSLTLVAQTSATAPGTNGAVFSALTDPVYDDAGDLAFGGTLKLATGTVTAATENGVWASQGGTPALLAREGSVAPGTGGALFGAFTGTGLCQNGAIVAGTLTTSTSLGVTALNDAGVWEGSTSNNLRLMLRAGETAGAKTISSFKLFPVETYVSGQTRAFGPTTGHLAVTATFTDKTSGIVDVITASAPVAVATVGEVAAGTTGATFATFGSPAINDSDEVAFYATLKSGVGDATAKNDSGIWSGYGAGTKTLVARLGEIAPGTGTAATFLTFSDPVENANGAAAFRATLSVGTEGATSTTNTGIWCDSTGALALVARTGAQAPGCLPGVLISAITELALDDVDGATQQGGVIFLATLTGAGVTAANGTAIFAQDDSGALQLIVRTGDAPNGKTITALTFLPAELATGSSPVNGQGRNVSGATGDLIYNATFSDKSQGIFNVVFQPPTP